VLQGALVQAIQARQSKKMNEVSIGEIRVGGNRPIVLIGGLCVIENEEHTLRTATRLKEICGDVGVPFIFKASYDKANRSSLHSYRGPGLGVGLEILRKVKENVKVAVLTDVHRFEEIERAAEVADVLQVPAFLCRQTDFVLAVAKTQRAINVKKGQFLAPWDVRNIVEKIESTGNKRILLTERGTSFGYNNLVSDMRSLVIMRALGYPVVYDATHSVQLPGGAGTASTGNREYVPYLARAAAAVGIDALFVEVHEQPERALSDGANSLDFEGLGALLRQVKTIDSYVKKEIGK
jgi:2-dehydro-3-deoxyphosphooctonate aldolase (KDO 8-P synthase)